MLHELVLTWLFLFTWVECSGVAKTHYVKLKVFGRKLEIPRSRGIAIVGYVDAAVEKFRGINWDTIDFSCGAVGISSIQHWEVQFKKISFDNASANDSSALRPTKNRSNLRRAYQLGSKAVKKVISLIIR